MPPPATERRAVKGSPEAAMAAALDGRRFGPNSAPATAQVFAAPPRVQLRANAVHLGDVENHPVGIDLQKLIDGRLLIQGISGAGKSWTLRRIMEQTAGRMPQIVVDPEGEFSELGETLGMVRLDGHRLDLSRRYTATFSAAQVGKILGVDSKTVTREILQGDLAAVKRPTRRLPQQGGDPWSIERSALKRYIVDHLDRVDLRKVDKFAFVDVLVNDGSESKQPANADGRKASWSPERRAAQAERMRARWRAAGRSEAA